MLSASFGEHVMNLSERGSELATQAEQRIREAAKYSFCVTLNFTAIMAEARKCGSKRGALWTDFI